MLERMGAHLRQEIPEEEQRKDGSDRLKELLARKEGLQKEQSEDPKRMPPRGHLLQKARVKTTITA